MKRLRLFSLTALFGMAFISAPTQAALLDVTVMVENLAPTNSIAFAPLRVGFHNGTFDAFDNGAAATAPIISIAEGGTGADWFPAFAAADPTAVLGTVANGGPAVPAGNAGVGNTFSSTASNTFRVDTSVNPFFTFANMVVPSNDLFLGNDNAIQLFDASGNLLVNQINQTGASIWDAGSEVADPANAAFLVGGVNANRTPENDVVSFDFSELSAFNGLATPAGYNFDSTLITNGTDIFRITFTTAAVPEPASVVLLSLGLAAFAWRRRKNKLTVEQSVEGAMMA